MESISWIDSVIIGVLIISTVLGVFRGFLSVVFGILGIVAGFIVAKDFGGTLAKSLQLFLGKSVFSTILGYAIVFFIVFVLFGLIGRLARVLLKKIDFGGFDAFGGFLFGLTRGTLYSMLFIFVLCATPVIDSEAWHKSETVPYGGYLIYSIMQIPVLKKYERWLEFDEDYRPQVVIGNFSDLSGIKGKQELEEESNQKEEQSRQEVFSTLEKELRRYNGKDGPGTIVTPPPEKDEKQNILPQSLQQRWNYVKCGQQSKEQCEKFFQSTEIETKEALKEKIELKEIVGENMQKKLLEVFEIEELQPYIKCKKQDKQQCEDLLQK